ncbi:hypothetical protein J6590_030865 [Homalodisca vitripennis]|nr:hypothetical protein J6590_030865 [Homalodisca vitripennis]
MVPQQIFFTVLYDISWELKYVGVLKHHCQMKMESNSFPPVNLLVCRWVLHRLQSTVGTVSCGVLHITSNSGQKSQK